MVHADGDACRFLNNFDGYRQQRENPAYDSTEAVKQLKMKLNWLKNGAYK